MKKFGLYGKLLIFVFSMSIVTFVLIYLVFYISFKDYTDFVMKKADLLLMDKYKTELKSTTEAAVTLYSAINSLDKLTSKEKLDLARKLIRPMRFGKDGYYFVYERGTGINRIHGAKPSLEGKVLWDLQDPDKTQYIIRELDRTAREKKIYHKYLWSKPGKEGLFPKLGTAMMVPGTDMWIGTGAYINDINLEKNKLFQSIEKITGKTKYKFIISFLFVGILAITIISIMAKNLVDPLKNMIASSREIAHGNYDIQIIAKTRDEIGQLAITFNEMAHRLKDYTENLENKVSERTNELQRTLEKLNETNSILENLSEKLSRYLSPQIRESIFTGKQDVKIESRRKKLTVFFSDIKNFTSTTERLETEDLTNLLNDYLEEMSQIALKYGATIDKFIGDAIMAFFGDPETMGDREDALACVSMAIEMRSRIRELQRKWLDLGISEPFHVRMGINTGYCTVGNFGSNERMDYTIIGSQVNLASRLESTAEPDQIQISHECYALIKDRIYCEKKGKIKVKGISYEVDTYRVIDFIEKIDRSEFKIEENLEGFSIKADLGLITPSYKKKILRTLRDTFNKIKEIDK